MKGARLAPANWCVERVGNLGAYSIPSETGLLIRLISSTILKCTELGQNLHMEWQPTTVDAVKKIIEGDLKECDDEQVSAFEKYAVEPYAAPILRYGKMESVVVVARRRDEVIYWEDVEEGFNRSPVAPDGRILEHWCNQDELRLALNA